MEVSKTFTGADSSSVLLMIIFYLVILLILVFVLKFLVKGIKSLFKEIKPARKTTTKEKNDSLVNQEQVSAKKSNPVSPEKTKQTAQKTQGAHNLKLFDGQEYVALLNNKYKLVDNCICEVELPQYIAASEPKFLAVEGMNKEILLSDDEKTAIVESIGSKNIQELKHLLHKTSEKSADFTKQITSLNNLITMLCKAREKLVSDELLTSNEHNSNVDELEATRSGFDNTKANLVNRYSELLSFISELDVLRHELWDKTTQFNKDVISVPGKINAFSNACEQSLQAILLKANQQDALVKSLKSKYLTVTEARMKKDEEILSQQSNIDGLLKNKLVCDETILIVKSKIEELEKAAAEQRAKEEAERIAREEAERLERERIAKEQAERKAREEAERKAREEAERIEKERLAREEAERLEKERLAREEAERIAKLEAEQKAKEEAERKAREEAERLEQERIAQKQAELAAKFEAERKAREEAELLENANYKGSVGVSGADGSEADADNSADPVVVNSVKEKVQQQAQSAYALSFDDIPTEMYEKIARGSSNRKINVVKTVSSNESNDDIPESNQPEQEQEAHSFVASSEDGAISETTTAETDGNNSDSSVSEAPASSPKIDHMAELKKQWAAEKAHKEQFAAEQARKKAEEEKRKAELLKGDLNNKTDNK